MFIYKHKSIIPFIALLFLIIYPQPSFSDYSVSLPLRLAWNRNAEYDLSYYRVYYGTSSRNYNHYITFNKQYSSCELGAGRLTIGKTYYIALTALDLLLNESGYSDELVVFIESSSTIPDTIITIIEAEEMSYHANGAQQGEYWVLWSNGTMNEEVYFPDTGIYRFEIIAKADLAYGVGPKMGLLIDGEIKGIVFVNTTTPETFVFNVEVPAGTHEFAIGFYNDYKSGCIDRNLYVDKTIIIPASGNVSTTTTTRQTTTTTTTSPTSTITTTTIPTSTTTTTAPSILMIEAEEMSYHTNGYKSGEYWKLLANGTMNEEVYFPDTGIYRFKIIAKGSLVYNVGPRMGLLIDGEIKGTVFVNTTTPETFVFNVEVPAGTHEFAIGFYNYYKSGCIDRNLYVDKTILNQLFIP